MAKLYLIEGRHKDGSLLKITKTTRVDAERTAQRLTEQGYTAVNISYC
jgi:hypothetical protein